MPMNSFRLKRSSTSVKKINTGTFVLHIMPNKIYVLYIHIHTHTYIYIHTYIDIYQVSIQMKVFCMCLKVCNNIHQTAIKPRIQLGAYNGTLFWSNTHTHTHIHKQTQIRHVWECAKMFFCIAKYQCWWFVLFLLLCSCSYLICFDFYSVLPKNETKKKILGVSKSRTATNTSELFWPDVRGVVEVLVCFVLFSCISFYVFFFVFFLFSTNLIDWFFVFDSTFYFLLDALFLQ